MTIQESLQSLTPYPIPDTTLETILMSRGLNATASEEEEDETVSEPESETLSVADSLAVTSDILNSKEYHLAKADLYMWLSVAPNISQGGQSYGFNADEKKQFVKWANLLYQKNGEPESAKCVYGYKGSRL